MQNTKSGAGAGAFGQWALLLAGARRNTRAGREADGASEAADELVMREADPCRSDDAANTGEGGSSGDTLVAGRDV